MTVDQLTADHMIDDLAGVFDVFIVKIAGKANTSKLRPITQVFHPITQFLNGLRPGRRTE